MPAPSTAAHLAHAFDRAFRRVLSQQPRQTLPTEVILDGLTVFCGGILCDMARASHLTPDQCQEVLNIFCTNLAAAIVAADEQRRDA